MYFSDGKGEFSAAVTPVFSVPWSFRNHTNMLKKHVLLLSMFKTVVLLNIYFLETVVHF